MSGINFGRPPRLSTRPSAARTAAARQVSFNTSKNVVISPPPSSSNDDTLDDLDDLFSSIESSTQDISLSESDYRPASPKTQQPLTSSSFASSAEEDFPALEIDVQHDFPELPPPERESPPPSPIRLPSTRPLTPPAQKVYPVPTPVELEVDTFVPAEVKVVPSSNIHQLPPVQLVPAPKIVPVTPTTVISESFVPVRTAPAATLASVTTVSETVVTRQAQSPPLPHPCPASTSAHPPAVLVKMVTSDHPNIEDILRKYGYNPLLKLMAEYDGQRRGEFVKAMNPLGVIVYIKLDIPVGYIAADSTDLVITKSHHEIAEIPYSARKTYFDLSVPESSGVAVECKHGICFISPTIHSEMKQDHYVYAIDTVHTHTSIKVLVDATLDAIPIISLREIQVNPRLVLQNVEMVYCRIASTVHATCIRDLNHFNQSLAHLNRAVPCFMKMSQMADAKLKHSTDQYRKRTSACLFSSAPRNNETFRRDYSSLLYNLQRRNELRVELARICRVMNSLGCQIDEVTRQIEELDRFGQEIFRGVEGCLRP